VSLKRIVGCNRCLRELEKSHGFYAHCGLIGRACTLTQQVQNYLLRLSNYANMLVSPSPPGPTTWPQVPWKFSDMRNRIPQSFRPLVLCDRTSYLASNNHHLTMFTFLLCYFVSRQVDPHRTAVTSGTRKHNNN